MLLRIAKQIKLMFLKTFCLLSYLDKIGGGAYRVQAGLSFTGTRACSCFTYTVDSCSNWRLCLNDVASLVERDEPRGAVSPLVKNIRCCNFVTLNVVFLTGCPTQLGF